jgi:peptidoglycan/LPS O-acetylase OafA/YrhL
MMLQEATPAEGPSPAGYVPQLDGLRAIAVLLVVLFHLGLRPFRSGFLGVDIFFVISGFLITSLLIAESERTGRISLSAFWARRARRLLPALALMLLAVALAGWLSATFSERASLRTDLLSTVGYVANWHFIRTASYFANTGVPSPVEHTWSLAIEEQFYLVWPLLVAGLIVASKRWLRAVAIVAVIGVVVSAGSLAVLWGPDSVERAYMGTDARIFEPLIGALGAILITSVGVRGRLERHGSWIGIVGAFGLVILIALVGPSGRGYYFGGALILSAMTLLVLASVWVGAAGPLGRTLGWRPLVWVGAISYGIYLWHWPVTIWLNARDPAASHLAVRRLLAIALTTAAAAASFYAVERRVRKRSRAGDRVRRSPFERDRNVLLGVPILIAMVACVSVAATEVPPPSPSDLVVMMAGDSVPKRLIAPLEAATEDDGWRVEDATVPACPATGEEPVDPSGREWNAVPTRCIPSVIPRQDEVLAATHPDIVIWWDRTSISHFESFDDELVISGTPRYWQLRQRALDAGVRRLAARGAIVVLVATEPVSPGLDTSWPWHRFQVDHYFDTTTRWNAMMRAYAERHPGIAAYVSITDAVCHAPVTSPCDDTVDGVSARPDGQHYAGPGADVAVNALLAQLAPVVQALGGAVPTGSAGA